MRPRPGGSDSPRRRASRHDHRRDAPCDFALGRLDLAELAFDRAGLFAPSLSAGFTAGAILASPGACTVDGLADLLHSLRQRLHRGADALRIVTLEHAADVGDRLLDPRLQLVADLVGVL